jgi:hypothetical protein
VRAWQVTFTPNAASNVTNASQAALRRR